jgi:hypothetical protein
MLVECFFYIEPDQNGVDEDGTVRALCVDCKMNRLPSDFPTWFYSGKIGPWMVRCHSCDKVIHPYEDNNENKET